MPRLSHRHTEAHRSPSDLRNLSRPNTYTTILTCAHVARVTSHIGHCPFLLYLGPHAQYMHNMALGAFRVDQRNAEMRGMWSLAFALHVGDNDIDRVDTLIGSA